MTKQHFIALANTIKANRTAYTQATLNSLAEFCQAQNPRFNRSRWFGYINETNGPNGGKVKVKA